jgi:hypothetical protein
MASLDLSADRSGKTSDSATPVISYFNMKYGNRRETAVGGRDLFFCSLLSSPLSPLFSLASIFPLPSSISPVRQANRKGLSKREPQPYLIKIVVFLKMEYLLLTGTL